MSNEGGCSHQYPGIGNIAYVKDMMSRKITTRNFNCSQFGGSFASGLGWVCVFLKQIQILSIQITEKQGHLESQLTSREIFSYRNVAISPPFKVYMKRKLVKFFLAFIVKIT